MKIFRKIFVFISVGFFLLTLTSLAISAIDRTKKIDTYKELELFADALSFIQSDYVDETKPKDLIYGALSGMINNLDPHSQFLTPQEYDDLKFETEGRFGGIGVELTMKDNLATVITAIEGTPAWEAGLESMDRIVKIGDEVIKNLSLNEIVKKLRGKPGTEVVLVVWRESEGKPRSFKIKRAIIDVKDIKEARVLDDHIAYLKLVEFRENTPVELDKVLARLKDEGMESLILDLRNNPGGLLEKAVEATERFLPKDALIVSVRGRNDKQNTDYKVLWGKGDTSLPLVVLVNEGSASGSEIMAGAFQDHKRAIIIGAKTFGKGSVQTVLPMNDGSALKLTTSRYFTPLGRSIHEIGVKPDIVVVQKESDKETAPIDGEEKDLDSIFENIENNEIESFASDEQKANLSDAQFLRAVDLLKK